MNRHVDKNGIYHDNMVYFLRNGISCSDATIRGDNNNDYDNQVVVKYVFVLTKEVADFYTSPEGPITKIREKCEVTQQQSHRSPELFIDVKIREDRCYDMESMRIVLDEIDVQASYDNLLFLNCGLVGPKFGPGSPKLIPTKGADGKVDTSKLVPYSHWTQLYTSRLDDEVRMVGQSINTHFHTFFPHVQSFLYAIKSETASILTAAGAIYDCGLNQIEFATHVEKRFELIERYEVGMSTTLLKQGYKIASAFINRWDMGNTIVLDSNSINEEKYKTIYGIALDDTVSDLWYESGLRNLTSVLNRDIPRDWWRRDSNNNYPQISELRKKEDTYDYHKYDLLPWDYFVFFKVSRLVTEDIQKEMNYNTLAENDVLVVPQDPRKSPDEFWLRKMGVLHDTPMYQSLLKCVVGFAILYICFKKRRQIKSRLIMSRVSMRAKCKNKSNIKKKDSNLRLKDGY